MKNEQIIKNLLLFKLIELVENKNPANLRDHNSIEKHIDNLVILYKKEKLTKDEVKNKFYSDRYKNFFLKEVCGVSDKITIDDLTQVTRVDEDDKERYLKRKKDIEINGEKDNLTGFLGKFNTFKIDYYVLKLGFNNYAEAKQLDFNISKKDNIVHTPIVEQILETIKDSHESIFNEAQKIKESIDKISSNSNPSPEITKKISSLSNKINSLKKESNYNFEVLERNQNVVNNQLLENQSRINSLLENIYNDVNKFDEVKDCIDKTEEKITGELKESSNRIQKGQHLILDQFEKLKQEILIKDSYIPRISYVSYSKFIWNKIRLFLGVNSWLYKLDKNAPLGLNAEALKETVNNYIPIDFQESIVFDEHNITYIDALGYLTHHVLKKQPFENSNVAQFFFVIATSGIGKTTLLLKLYLESRKKNIAKNNVYIIPFSKWRELYTLKKHEKNDAILLLDAIDEDFTLSSSEDLELIIDELRKITKEFSKVVITSRGEFFRKNNLLEKFNKRLSEHIDFSYQVISLCPFSDSQITTYLKKKFKRKDHLKKAKQIIQLIGKDTFHRQFLISKIDLLFDVLKHDSFISEAKGYFLFQTMLDKWLQRERLTVQNILNNSKDKKIEAFKSTIQFCKILAERFVIEKRILNNGFTFEEIQAQVKGTIDQSKILTNRTFLIRDINDKYRFSHNSILEFFCAQIAIENEEFDNNYFKDLKLHFASKMYEQGILAQIINIINVLVSKNLIRSVYYTISDLEIEKVYNNTFVSHSLLKIKKTTTYKKTGWDLFETLIKDVENHTKIKGLKFISNHHNSELKNKIEFPKKEAYLILKPILRFFNKLTYLDLSNMGLVDKDIENIGVNNLTILNLENNFLKNVSFKNKKFENINLSKNYDVQLSDVSLKNLIISYSDLSFKNANGYTYFNCDQINILVNSFDELYSVSIDTAFFLCSSIIRVEYFKTNEDNIPLFFDHDFHRKCMFLMINLQIIGVENNFRKTQLGNYSDFNNYYLPYHSTLKKNIECSTYYNTSTFNKQLENNLLTLGMGASESFSIMDMSIFFFRLRNSINALDINVRKKTNGYDFFMLYYIFHELLHLKTLRLNFILTAKHPNSIFNEEEKYQNSDLLITEIKKIVSDLELYNYNKRIYNNEYIAYLKEKINDSKERISSYSSNYKIKIENLILTNLKTINSLSYFDVSNIKTLYISTKINRDPLDFSFLKEAKSLQVLNIQSPYGNIHFDFNNVKELENLYKIELKLNQDAEISNTEVITINKNITHLTFDVFNPDNRKILHIGNQSNLKELRINSFSINQIFNKNKKTLFTHLEVLEIFYHTCFINGSNFDFKILEHMPKLKHIELKNIIVDAENLSCIEKSKLKSIKLETAPNFNFPGIFKILHSVKKSEIEKIDFIFKFDTSDDFFNSKLYFGLLKTLDLLKNISKNRKVNISILCTKTEHVHSYRESISILSSFLNLNQLLTSGVLEFNTKKIIKYTKSYTTNHQNVIPKLFINFIICFYRYFHIKEMIFSDGDLKLRFIFSLNTITIHSSKYISFKNFYYILFNENSDIDKIKSLLNILPNKVEEIKVWNLFFNKEKENTIINSGFKLKYITSKNNI